MRVVADEHNREERRTKGIDCPGCKVARPKAYPTRLMPGRKCRVCGTTYEDAQKGGMSFLRAKNFVMPFGKHRGKTLDQIATDDEGLKYLDWMRGDMGEDDGRDIAQAIRAYLDDETIAADLAAALE